MAQHTLSLKQNSKGQILIEGLIIIAFLLGFLILLQSLHLTAQNQIQQERLSKKTEKRKAGWVKAYSKEVQFEIPN